MQPKLVMYACTDIYWTQSPFKSILLKLVTVVKVSLVETVQARQCSPSWTSIHSDQL